MAFLDEATVVRPGEDLDPQKVAAFLKSVVPGLSGELVIRQFPSGYSNLTYLLTMGDQEWVLRRPPMGTKAETAHDMGREYRILKALGPVFAYCPHPLAYTEDPAIMGCPFYIMERLHGIILRKDLPPGLSFTPRQARGLCEHLVDVHVNLHRIDFKAVGLENFGKPRGYVRRQVEGWSARYRAARTDDAPDFEAVMAWLLKHMPPDTKAPAIVHNDYKLDNCVLDPADPSAIIGILDWEMTTLGDPLMDLGNSLAYWVEQNDPPDMHRIRTMLTHMKGALTRQEIIQRYAEKSGRSVSDFDFYSAFGLFRLAVIAQQIYYRYYHGQTQDERFKELVGVVHVLERRARNLASEA